MESLGSFADGELDLLRILFSNDEPDQYPFASSILEDRPNFQIPPTLVDNPDKALSGMDYMGGVHESLYCSSVSDLDSFNLQCFSESSFSSACSNGFLNVPVPSLENYGTCNYVSVASDQVSVFMDVCVNGGNNDSFVTDQETVCLGENMTGEAEIKDTDNVQPQEISAPVKALPLKRKPARSSKIASKNDKTDVEMPEKPKRKPRLSSDVQKTRKKNMPAKKNQKLTSLDDDNEESNVKEEGQSSSTCSSEDDVSSQELKDSKTSESLSSDVKTRAGRGAATDPQSLYARKRRERINERLKILQNLIPNGTKVDISTMLEEAVHYVKFLQLQIKLLSSDDLWMYAPIAYNGKDIGLDKIIFPQL
ncbi:hypothetical protein ACJRO7_024139 [Eucalyptus globulus]|uniref:BHLH domain-containing protein n=1 Tax=Eucalyptus globulus TaxID=34317 RepID=A0ABD3KB44_EUCGL